MWQAWSEKGLAGLRHSISSASFLLYRLPKSVPTFYAD
jgi:hypothetical protein